MNRIIDFYKKLATLLIAVIAILAVVVLLAGCTTSYKHLSDPRVDGDGYDLMCGGFEKGQQIVIAVDVCRNVAANKGEFLFVDIKYRWAEQ